MLESRRQLVNNAFTAASGSAIGNAVAYINIKYKEDITLNQLCEISGYSHQHFCRLFKAQMGMRPMEYIARRRIAQSKTLLADSELTISQIGSDVRYPEPTYLEWFSENMKEFLQVNIENAETVLKYNVHQYTCTPEDSLIIIWHGNSTLTYS